MAAAVLVESEIYRLKNEQEKDQIIAEFAAHKMSGKNARSMLKKQHSSNKTQSN